jgi:Ras-related protein Rab-32
MDEYCQQNGFAGWFETSAKENTNIDESAKALVSKVSSASFIYDIQHSLLMDFINY